MFESFFKRKSKKPQTSTCIVSEVQPYEVRLGILEHTLQEEILGCNRWQQRVLEATEEVKLRQSKIDALKKTIEDERLKVSRIAAMAEHNALRHRQASYEYDMMAQSALKKISVLA